MVSPTYIVSCFTRALVSPGYTPETDDRWLDCLWGTYTSQKCAELAIFNEIINDPDFGNYKILYEEDIEQFNEDGETEHVWGDYDREIMRFVITVKDHGIPVMEIAVSLVKSEPIPESEYERDYPEEFKPSVESEWEKRIEDYFKNGPPKNSCKTPELFKMASIQMHDKMIDDGCSNHDDWIWHNDYGWVEKNEITDYEFEKAHPEEIKKFGGKTTEERSEAYSLHDYELSQRISTRDDWIFSNNYGWFKKEWAFQPEEETEQETEEEDNQWEKIENTSMFADWVHGV